MIITNIKDSIVKALKTSYPTYEIYDEIIKQGFQEPCFFVKIIEQDTKKECKNRFKFNIMFDIHCFLDENTVNMDEQYHMIAEDLYEKLELFSDLSGGNLRGLNKRHNIEDKILHFFLDINVSVTIPVESVNMGTLDTNSYIKD
ncbi:phage tail terminator family protein [Pseudobacteroides cellulosolvens]|uniref:Phage protein n=1 Tax=Pseudobacteroides cellulosolvens ATCC 35603 = DSM 2933 TaxID=398512 RepID=A0A0L6JHN4_9FIRM|nr:hypothetical protein [Pseudobacteroides cellulosolvens]KNY25002.1 hypothetical protein Bccel_0259 [Pseudobacteroides cellulosolvens ATCC 35603 = DSM 2933]